MTTTANTPAVPYVYDPYVCTPDTVTACLAEHGVAIVPGILTEAECAHITDGTWKFFEHLTQAWPTPMRQNDATTWRGMYDLFPSHGQLFQHWNIGHAQVSWDVRQNLKVVDVFARIWSCAPEDMLVSFDGLSLSLPPEKTNRGWGGRTWFHTDQSFTRPNFECVQGWVTANDVGEGDATLSIMSKSHIHHAEFATRFGVVNKNNWYKLKPEEEAFYTSKGCQYQKIRCPKGCLVLWDSRTIHCGANAMRGRAAENTRNIIYVCYTPRALSDEKALKKKRLLFDTMRTCSHWPHTPKAFPKIPRTYGAVLQETTAPDPPVLTALGRRLAGF